MSESYKIYASENYVETKIAELVNSAPETLNTLNELATALGNDPNFAATIAAEIGSKASANDLTSHIDNKSNPHGITVSQIGAATKTDISDAISSINYPVDSVNGKTGDVTLTATDVGALPNTTEIPSIDGLASESYVNSAITNITYPVSSVNSKTGEVVLTASDVGAAGTSHTQSASSITGGTFAGAVVAYTSGQTPSTMLLRNSKLVSTETNPSNNGEICWLYE